MQRIAQRHRRSDEGATAVEYGLMVGFIALVVMGSISALGQVVKGLFEGVLPGF